MHGIASEGAGILVTVAAIAAVSSRWSAIGGRQQNHVKYFIKIKMRIPISGCARPIQLPEYVYM